MQRKFWIGVACKEHVTQGKEWGICQFCHGKKGPAARIKNGDFLVYYSPKIAMEGKIAFQKFSAIGRVIDDAPYQVDMGNGFMPYRRRIAYYEAQDLDIRPLIMQLPFIQNKTRWGYTFRYGFIEIDEVSFNIIAQGMLGYNPSQGKPQ